MIECQVTIVGGGLSGLYAAYCLQKMGIDYQLIEARNRLGGRIASYVYQSKTGSQYAFDTGPSWFWPEYQEKIIKLIGELNLSYLNQFTQGEMLYEPKDAPVTRYPAASPMEDSFRIEGGNGKLIEALINRLQSEQLNLNTRLIQVEVNTEQEIMLTTEGELGPQIKTQHLILALPPRVIAHNIAMGPLLSEDILTQMRQVPTWMAGHAKILAIYDLPFWRECGLSGEVFSQVGPLSEIHDISYSDMGPFGLFGFVGISPKKRASLAEGELIDLAKQQLIKLFGKQASDAEQIILKDWAFTPYTATDDDLNPMGDHPRYGMIQSLDSLSEQRLYFAGTELSDIQGGYMEGAIISADRAVKQVLETL